MDSISDIPFVGGNAALDFVNTAEDRGDPRSRDWLQTAADLVTWGRRSGVLNRSAVACDADELTRARDARELIHALLAAKAAGRGAQRDQLVQLQRLAADAYAHGSLERTRGGQFEWRWSATDPASVRHVVVTEAIALLGSDTGTRLKQCPGDHCGWLFLDTTKRGNRRWCSMSECGQDAKDAARRRKRKRASESAGPIRFN